MCNLGICGDVGLLKSAVYEESGAGLMIIRSEGRLGMSESDMLERPKHRNEIRQLNKRHGVHG